MGEKLSRWLLFGLLFSLLTLLVTVKISPESEGGSGEAVPGLVNLEQPTIIFSDVALLQDSKWRLPIHGETILSSNSRDHATRYPYVIKYAWDFYAPRGTMVYPSKRGKVIVASYGNEHGYGHWVQIDHGSAISTIYGHMGTLRVCVGQQVTTNTPLGEIANTGETDWPHIHFEVRRNGVRFEPAKVFGNPKDIGLKYLHYSQIGDFW